MSFPFDALFQSNLGHDHELLSGKVELLDRLSKDGFGHAVRVAVGSVERGDTMLPTVGDQEVKHEAETYI